MALFVLARSPFERNDYKTSLSLAMAEEGSEAILIQDAVVGLLGGPVDYSRLMSEAKERGVRLYALEEDLKARGISIDNVRTSGVEVVDYRGFVDLLLRHGKAV